MLVLPVGIAERVSSVTWDSLVEDSGADIAIVQPDGKIVYASEVIAWWAIPVPAKELVGRNISELFTPEFARERLDVIARVASSHRPIVLHGIWKGVRTRTVFRSVPINGNDRTASPLVMMVCRGYSAFDRDRETTAEMVDAQHVDHGKLGVLTPRELEILSMIAQGMTTASIAKALFRSRKTIEAHRLSLGAKLGARNRVELARIAVESGLLAGQPGSSSHITGRRYEKARKEAAGI